MLHFFDTEGGEFKASPNKKIYSASLSLKERARERFGERFGERFPRSRPKVRNVER